MRLSSRLGLTLIEIVVTLAIIGITAGIGFMVANPFGQIADARNDQRALHLQSIMLAIRQNMADSLGQEFSCSSGALPTSTKRMASSGTLSYNIAPCLVPTYILVLPVDQGLSGAHYSSNSDYDTGYDIVRNASTSQVTLSAPGAELNQTITLIR